jgi:hypothetical protein
MPINFAAIHATPLKNRAALTNKIKINIYAVRFCVVVLFCILFVPPAASQRRQPINNFELFAGVGATRFSGDIGNSDKILQTLGFTVGGGVRYYLSNRWALRAGFNYGTLSATDSLSSTTFHKYRNLDFKTNIADFSLLAEFSIFNWRVHKAVKGRKKYLTNRHNLYVFGGISIFHFHPYGRLNDEWYSLPELSTAGQGLPGGPTAYKLNSFSIPLGMGYKFLIRDGFSIGLEVTFRKTFTDNIDDVSAPYYDNVKLRQLRGDLAADIADKGRFPGGGKRANGVGRGNPNSNDNFAFFVISFNKQLNVQNGRRSACAPF